MDIWDYSFWDFYVQLGILMVAILVANTLRRKIPFIRKSLLPSSVMGGLMVLILRFIPAFDRLINQEFMTNAAFHMLGLGFIAISLKKSDNVADKAEKGVVPKTGALVVNTYLLQAILGLAITIPLSLGMNELLAASGLILALGYGQGTGQALAWGRTYETQYGFSGGASFGLTIATVGFIVACVFGAIYLNILKAQKKVTAGNAKSAETLEKVYDPNDIPLSESIDKFTVQAALILAIYLMAFLFMQGLTLMLDAGWLGDFGIKTVKPLIWGFYFLFGTLLALLTKRVIFKLRKSNVMTREYPNNFLLNRAAGFIFDLMVLAGCAAIQFETIKGLLLPIVLLCAVGLVATFIYLEIVCKRLYPTYRYEAMVSLFGMLTGTASTGMILLREIDPNFETPAANNLVLQNLFAIMFGFPLMLLLGYAPWGTAQSLITGGILIVMFIAFNFFIFAKRKAKPAGPLG